MSEDMIVVSRKPIHPGEFLREDYSRTLIGVERPGSLSPKFVIYFESLISSMSQKKSRYS